MAPLAEAVLKDEPVADEKLIEKEPTTDVEPTADAESVYSDVVTEFSDAGLIASNRPAVSLHSLAEADPRWKRLLHDAEGLFTGGEAISEAYEAYLSEMLGLMEEHRCSFKQAVMLTATSADPDSQSQLGVVDYLKMRKAGRPLSDALIFNLKASTLGPGRAEVCAWRRKEAKSALSKGELTVTLAESTLAKGLDCTDRELQVVESSLAEAQRLCWRLDRSLEILEANSSACGEGPEVMEEYSELIKEAAAVTAGLESNARLLAEVRARMWSWEYVGVVLRNTFTLGLKNRRGCAPEVSRSCTTCEGPHPRSFLNHDVLQEMRVEVLAAVDLKTSGLSGANSSDGKPDGRSCRNVYVEVELGGCRMSTTMGRGGYFAKRNLLFAYGGEPTLCVQVFEQRSNLLETFIAGDLLIGEAHLLLDHPAEDGSPRSVDLPIMFKDQQTGTIVMQYQLIAY